MYFSGRDMMTDQPLFKNTSNSFTYEFWVKPEVTSPIVQESVNGITGTQGQPYIMGPGHVEASNAAGIGISIGTNGVLVFEHTGYHLPALLVCQVPISDWTHISVVFKNKRPFLYINGEYKKRGLNSRKKDLYPSGQIGGYEPYGSFIGHVKDIKLWNYAKSERELKAGMHIVPTGEEKGLIRYWWFNDNVTISPPHLINFIRLARLPAKS